MNSNTLSSCLSTNKLANSYEEVLICKFHIRILKIDETLNIHKDLYTYLTYARKVSFKISHLEYTEYKILSGYISLKWTCFSKLITWNWRRQSHQSTMGRSDNHLIA